METINELVNSLIPKVCEMFRDLDYTLPEVEWIVENKRVRTLGRCRRKPNKKFQLWINEFYIQDSNIANLKDTMAHEMSHAVADCLGSRGHDGIWKNIIRRINRAYNMRISTYASKEKIAHVEADLIKRPKSIKGYMVCSHCGYEIPCYKDSNRTRRPDLYRHSSCGSPFTYQSIAMHEKK